MAISTATGNKLKPFHMIFYACAWKKMSSRTRPSLDMAGVKTFCDVLSEIKSQKCVRGKYERSLDIIGERETITISTRNRLASYMPVPSPEFSNHREHLYKFFPSTIPTQVVDESSDLAHICPSNPKMAALDTFFVPIKLLLTKSCHDDVMLIRIMSPERNEFFKS
uniref:Uncharacterized protein n=1 Tax=Romanomermis culicivorax TaxID=13658 RepID=A0A915JPG2_ROMCU